MNINWWISKHATSTFHYLLRNRPIIFIFYRTVLTLNKRVYIYKHIFNASPVIHRKLKVSDHILVTFRSHSIKGHVDLQHCETGKQLWLLITEPGLLSPHCIFSPKVHPISFVTGKVCKSKASSKYICDSFSVMHTYSLHNHDFKLGYHNKHLRGCIYFWLNSGHFLYNFIFLKLVIRKKQLVLWLLSSWSLIFLKSLFWEFF